MASGQELRENMHRSYQDSKLGRAALETASKHTPGQVRKMKDGGQDVTSDISEDLRSRAGYGEHGQHAQDIPQRTMDATMNAVNEASERTQGFLHNVSDTVGGAVDTLLGRHSHGDEGHQYRTGIESAGSAVREAVRGQTQRAADLVSDDRDSGRSSEAAEKRLHEIKVRDEDDYSVVGP